MCACLVDGALQSRARLATSIYSTRHLAAMSNSVLDPSALTAKLPKLLPQEKQTLQSPQDALAAIVHTAMSVLGFRLISIDDASPMQTFQDNVLPVEWNTHGPGSYTFRYKHEQSSLEFVVKLGKLGGRTTINAIALEVRTFANVLGRLVLTTLLPQSDKVASLNIGTDDFSSPSFFPADLSASDAGPLVHAFISSNRISDFMSQFQLMIVQKLVPGLRKDGYTEQAETESTRPGPSQPQPARPQPVPPPQAPDHDDPLRMPPRNPLEIGRRDRDPFPRNPFAPPSLFPGSEDDGMFVGPNHPIFNPGLGGQGRRGPWGGDGFLPPMGAPPGARFDPVGPGIGPFPGGPIPGRGPGRGMPGGGNMGDPDFDDFPPPGPGVSTPNTIVLINCRR